MAHLDSKTGLISGLKEAECSVEVDKDIKSDHVSYRDPWKHRSIHMTCVSCMWFVKKEADGPTLNSVGRCRRHAPVMSGYPVVYSTDWCGDHKLDENKV